MPAEKLGGTRAVDSQQKREERKRRAPLLNSDLLGARYALIDICSLLLIELT